MKIAKKTTFHLEPTNLGNQLPVDLSNSDSLGAFTQVINEVKPDVIVHLATITYVDQCQIERNAADNVNHISVKELVNYVVSNKDLYCMYLRIMHLTAKR
jgi:dTDP-4-dehydrorhamnose reductase